MKNENVIIAKIQAHYSSKINTIFVDNKSNKIHVYLKESNVDVILFHENEIYITSLKPSKSEDLYKKLKLQENTFEKLSSYIKNILKKS